MARRKETEWQHDFGLGSVRPEAVERDDIDLIRRSVQECSNTITLTTGQLEGRPGTIYLSAADGELGAEIPLGDGLVFDLNIHSGGLRMYNLTGDLVTEKSITWTSLTGIFGSPTFDDLSFAIVPDPDRVRAIILSQHFPPQSLYYDGAAWQFGVFEFSSMANGAQNIAFWRHYPTTKLQPSGKTGTITVTASNGIWTDAHAGAYIRYVDRQIQLTTRVSATVFNADVIEELPPTLDIDVASASGFQVGDAVEAKVSGGQGVITAIATNTLTVLVTTNFSGFNTGEDLVGPNASSNMTTVANAASLANSYLWDMQFWNSALGFPGAGTQHGGRMYLCDFPNTPNGFCASAAQDIEDLSMGPNDGDGFAESLRNDLGGELKFMVSAEDLLFFTTRGLFYQGSRDGSVITPETIRPKRFSSFGCSKVQPVAVDDGAIFVDSTGTQIHAAMLAGDIYKSWRVEQISKYAPHVISTPIRLGATSSGSDRPELFIVATQEDGTAAVAQWDRDQNIVSWRPWNTVGEFKAIYQAGGKLHAIVERTINAVTSLYRERFEYGATVDCMSSLFVSSDYPTGEPGFSYLDATGALAAHLIGHVCQVDFLGFDMGDRTVVSPGRPEDEYGEILTYPEGSEGHVQIGLAYEMILVPWARRSVKTQRGVRAVKRVIEMYVSVLSTGVFEVNGKGHNGYRVNEDLTKPVPQRSTQVRIAFLGGNDYERVEIRRKRPGKFTLTKLGYRVTI